MVASSRPQAAVPHHPAWRQEGLKALFTVVGVPQAGAPSPPTAQRCRRGQRTPFTGSTAETQGTRGDTGDEAIPADITPGGLAAEREACLARGPKPTHHDVIKQPVCGTVCGSPVSRPRSAASATGDRETIERKLRLKRWVLVSPSSRGLSGQVPGAPSPSPHAQATTESGGRCLPTPLLSRRRPLSRRRLCSTTC